MTLFEPQIAVKLEQYATMPTKAHFTDAGYDLYSPVEAYVPAGMSVMIDTGVRISLQIGTVGFVKSRSSMFKRGIATDGTIDCGYTGPIKVVLHNLGTETQHINKGDRVAQLVIQPIVLGEMFTVDELEETQRGDGGFGSTGK